MYAIDIKQKYILESSDPSFSNLAYFDVPWQNGKIYYPQAKFDFLKIKVDIRCSKSLLKLLCFIPHRLLL